MKEDYVTYEQAVKLKELGFDWECLYLYDESQNSCENPIPYTKNTFPANHNNGCKNTNGWEYISAPTLSLAQKWLRDVKGLSIRVSYIQYHKTWFSDWLNLETGEYDDTDATFDSYELALSAGIDAALRILENKVSCSASGKAD